MALTTLKIGDVAEQNPRDIFHPHEPHSLSQANRLPQGDNYVGINRRTERYSAVQTTVKNPQII